MECEKIFSVGPREFSNNLYKVLYYGQVRVERFDCIVIKSKLSLKKHLMT